MNILLAPRKRSSYLYLSAKIVTLAPFPQISNSFLSALLYILIY